MAHMINVRAVEDRIRSAKGHLKQSVGKLWHLHVSKIQCAALIVSIKHAAQTAGFTADIRGNLSNLIQEVQFTAEDSDRVQQALVPQQMPSSVARRKQQNYSSLVVMFNEHETRGLLDRGATSGQRLEIIVCRAGANGCRCIDERSAKMLASLWMVLSEPPENLGQLSGFSKAAMLKHFKATLKAGLDKLDTPTEYLHSLPESPAEFKQLHPKLYKEAYMAQSGKILPPTGRCLVDLELLIKFNQSYQCRDRGNNAGLQCMQSTAGWQNLGQPGMCFQNIPQLQLQNIPQLQLQNISQMPPPLTMPGFQDLRPAAARPRLQLTDVCGGFAPRIPADQTGPQPPAVVKIEEVADSDAEAEVKIDISAESARVVEAVPAAPTNADAVAPVLPERLRQSAVKLGYLWFRNIQGPDIPHNLQQAEHPCKSV